MATEIRAGSAGDFFFTRTKPIRVIGAVIPAMMASTKKKQSASTKLKADSLQNDELASFKKATSAALLSRPRITLRCGKRPKRMMMLRCFAPKITCWSTGPR